MFRTALEAADSIFPTRMTLDVLIIIEFYSWGMTWHFKSDDCELFR